MKLTYYGKFVEDNHPFAEHEIEGGPSKLIITLVNVLDLFKGEVCEWSRWTKWGKVKYIKALNEYLNFNVDNFDDFTITDKLVDIGCGDIKMPVSIFKSLDDESEHCMVVVGKPGELHYLLKENKTLGDCVKDNQGLISFSMKSGEELMFMKNYINERDYVREQYYPDGKIKVEVFELQYYIKNENVRNKSVCQSSAFDYPECYAGRYLEVTEKIFVHEIEPGKYEIDVRDCDGRPYPDGVETREGDSLYSVYYQYMVEKGYFKGKEDQKVR